VTPFDDVYVLRWDFFKQLGRAHSVSAHLTPG